MIYGVICGVALLASGLTFFSGFGLGTLLLPAFALFFPVDRAIALTAVVHFLNGLFKLALVGRQADRKVVIRFGLPSIIAAFTGAGVLLWLTGLGSVFDYSLFGRRFEVTPVKLVVGVLLLVFAAVEVLPRFRDLGFNPRYLPLGGAISGFFGGLAGMQGALRSAFLVRVGLTKRRLSARASWWPASWTCLAWPSTRGRSWAALRHSTTGCSRRRCCRPFSGRSSATAT